MRPSRARGDNYLSIPYNDFDGLTQTIAERLDLTEALVSYKTNMTEKIA